MKKYKIFLYPALLILIIFIHKSVSICTERPAYAHFLGVPVTITAYNPVEAQTDTTPNITASNKEVRHGMIALSRDLEKDFGFEFGDLITIYNVGVFEFEDRMNKRWKRRVDILMKNKDDAKKFGEQKGWIILGIKKKHEVRVFSQILDLNLDLK